MLRNFCCLIKLKYTLPRLLKPFEISARARYKTEVLETRQFRYEECFLECKNLLQWHYILQKFSVTRQQSCKNFFRALMAILCKSLVFAVFFFFSGFEVWRLLRTYTAALELFFRWQVQCNSVTILTSHQWAVRTCQRFGCYLTIYSFE